MMKQPSIQTGLFLSAWLLLTPSVMAAGAHWSDAEAAIPAFKDKCGAAMVRYETGLPDAGEMATQSATERAGKLSDSFRQVMRETELALLCYQSAMKHANTAEAKSEIEAGMDKAAWIYASAQSEFEQSLEAISNDLLGEVAPAAGPGGESAETAVARESTALKGMEILFDSYMLFERSQGLSRRLAGRGATSK